MAMTDTPGQRGVRPAVPGLLRLGHVVAGRDRRRVLRVQLQPRLAPAAPARDARGIGTGLIFFKFSSTTGGAGSWIIDDIGFEADWYMDWKVNKNFTFSFRARTEPGEAVLQAFN
jgi:hypothetical protein